MEQRVSFITLMVADLGRSRQFYEDGLRWSPRYTDDHIAFYALPGGVLGLYANPNSALPPFPVAAGAVMLTCNVRSRLQVDETLAAAAAAGAMILHPARDTPWGDYAGQFADPDGHPWEVAWNPDIVLDDAGHAALPS